MHNIAWHTLTIGEHIGSGTAGDVYRGQYRGAPAAIKQIMADLDNSEKERKIDLEVSVLSRLAHPHIVQLFGICRHEVWVEEEGNNGISLS
jgi:serine/threonine protein kinase